MAALLIAAAVYLSIGSTAFAAQTGASLGVTASPAQQSATTFGSVSLATTTAVSYDGITVPPGGPGCSPPSTITTACKYFPPANRLVLTYDPDIQIDRGTLPQCPAESIVGMTAAEVQATCPDSIIGDGTATYHTLTEPGTPAGNPGIFNAVVTVLNGTISGNPALLFHHDIPGTVTKPIWSGTLTSPNVLDIAIPVIPGVVVTHFAPTLFDMASGPSTRLVSARCTDLDWGSQADFTFSDASTRSATAHQACQTLEDAAMDVIVNGQTRAAAGEKTVIAKVTNASSTVDITVSDGDIGWSILVGGSPTTGTVSPLDPGTTTLRPGASTRFKFTWTYGPGEVTAGAAIDFTACVTIAADSNAGNDCDTESRTAR